MRFMSEAIGVSPMPRKKKPAHELTSDELAARVFGKKGAAQLKKAAQEAEKPTKPASKSSSPKQSR
jgi:hypothetical protein